MTKDKTPIKELKYGELHLYYPFKLDTKLSFEKICEVISKSDICFNDDYYQRVMESLGRSASKMTEDIGQALQESNIENCSWSFNVKNSISDKTFHPNENLESEYEVNSNNIRIELSSYSPSLKINIVSEELESLQQRLDRLKKESSVSKKIYGQPFMENHERILLVPFRAKLTNNRWVWIHAVLFIFRNKMGVLKLELPLIDTNITPLKYCDIDSLVNSIDNYWKTKNFRKDMKLSHLFNYYMTALYTNGKINIRAYASHEIRNIIFVDFDKAPKQINNLSPELQEEFFRIVSAPVPDYPYTSYAKDAQEHIKKYSWGQHGIKYIIKTNGGVLSLIDKDLLNYYIDNFKEQLCVSELSNIEYINMCKQIATNINVNIEFAILIIMQKKQNEANNIFEKAIKKESLVKVQREYYKNILFINELQIACYGSVINQTNEIERMMNQYLRSDISNSTKAALDNLLRDEKQQKDKKFIDFITIGSFLISLTFGLPLIYESLSIIHKLRINFLIIDFPIITLENVSVTLWLLLNLFILFYIVIIKFRR